MKRFPESSTNEFRPQLTVVGGAQGSIATESNCRQREGMTGSSNRHGQPKRAPVYEVVSGQPTWGRLYRLASEVTAHMAVNSIVRAIKTEGRCTVKCETALSQLSNHLNTELPAAIVRDVLNLCLARDRFRCHHNPTDCLALELWRVFYNPKFTDISVVHHEFAFPKTTNYPEIIQNLEYLFSQISNSLPYPPTAGEKDIEYGPLTTNTATSDERDIQYELIDEDPYSKSLKLNTGEVVIQDNLTCVNSGQHTKDKNSRYQNSGGCNVFCERCGKYKDGEKSKLQQPTNGKATNVIKTGDKKSSFATISSFKLELKHCEVGCILQDQVVLCVTKLADGLRFLEIPGLGSDELLNVIGM